VLKAGEQDSGWTERRPSGAVWGSGPRGHAGRLNDGVRAGRRGGSWPVSDYGHTPLTIERQQDDLATDHGGLMTDRFELKPET